MARRRHGSRNKKLETTDMSVVINTNSAASLASYNLSNTNVNLQRSLNRLSSGYRINSSFDDAGGLAVSMKMSAAIRRTDAAATNVGNAISFLQTQDGVMKTADKVLVRMSELATLAQDVTKSSDDIANYALEFETLTQQLIDFSSEEFNGIALFENAAGLTVATSEDGTTQTVGVSQSLINTNTDLAVTVAYAGVDLSAANAAARTTEIQASIVALGLLRATNGSEQSRLSFAEDMLKVNKTNLEAANSRIIDVDVAAESTQLARFNILQQSGTAMLAQANQSSQSILRLLV
jgi:flagellin